MIRSGGQIIFLRMQDIDWVAVEDNYVSVHVGRETHILRCTLESMEERFEIPHCFFEFTGLPL